MYVYPVLVIIVLTVMNIFLLNFSTLFCLIYYKDNPSFSIYKHLYVCMSHVCGDKTHTSKAIIQLKSVMALYELTTSKKI